MENKNYDELEKELHELRERLREINIKIGEAAEDVKGCAERRDKIHIEMKPYLEHLRGIRALIDEKRKGLNELRKILAMKKMDAGSKRDELKKLQKRLKELQAVKDDVDELQRRMEEIDWKIQTQPLPREEERRLSNILEELATRLAKATQRLELEGKIQNLKKELNGLQEEIDKVRDEIGRIKEELGQIIEQRKSLREKIQELKCKSDGWHAKYIEAREKLMRLEAEKILISSRIIELQERLNKYKQEDEERKLREAKERLKAEAASKLSSGKKLTFEEFKALLEDEESLEKLIGKS